MLKHANFKWKIETILLFLFASFYTITSREENFILFCQFNGQLKEFQKGIENRWLHLEVYQKTES